MICKNCGHKKEAHGKTASNQGYCKIGQCPCEKFEAARVEFDFPGDAPVVLK